MLVLAIFVHMITITGNITEQTYANVMAKMTTEPRPIQVFIDSAGGDLIAGLKIYDLFAANEMNIKVTNRRLGDAGGTVSADVHFRRR